MTPIKSLHIIGSREMGGAERWFIRFMQAMARHHLPAEAVVRKGSELARHHDLDVPTRELPLRTVWDPLSRMEVSRLVAASDAPVVQTYMGRATRLTHLKPGKDKVHVARLGGYYALHPFEHAHAWVGNTRGLCDWMIEQGLPADKVFHIYNFADPARHISAAYVDEMRRSLGMLPEHYLMLCLGRFVPVKGHTNLLHAFARLPLEIHGKRPRLLLVGDGPLRAELEQEAHHLDIHDRIIWAGWQQDPAPWLAISDMVVFPSRDEETLGNVILEAWAYGKPLVATRFRGAREIARNREDAMLVPCDTPLALANTVDKVIREPAVARELVANGLRRVSTDFAEGPILAQYQDLYRKLLGA